MSMQEFSAEDVRRKLLSAHERGELERELRRHWQQYVPAVYSAKLDADAGSEDRKARKLLFSPLEYFLCGNEDPDEVFQQLKDCDSLPQLCGKVFKLGEPTYSCRDCGVDPTCVLCIDCFENSQHKNHRYRMSTSGGGGYCDCGDEEAWRSHPYCQVHEQGAASSSRPDPITSLPPALSSRARTLYHASIHYAAEMLLWVHPDSLPTDLQAETRGDSYVTMLFNDEVHTYEQVIDTLRKACDPVTQKEAVEFATTVDREGRSPVLYGRWDACYKAKDTIVKNTSRAAGSKPLKVDVMHTSVVAHQLFAGKLLSWLQTIMSKTEGLRKLFCQVVMERPESGRIEPHQSVLETVMRADMHLWKAARVQTHQLFMSGILLDPDCKRQFAIIFTQMYPALMAQFIEDDHDHTVCAVSETVQIFTVPTLARMLIAEHNLLEVILNPFLDECDNKLKDGKFAFEKQDRHHSFRRAQYGLYDLKYALVAKPTVGEWTPELRKNFVNGYQALLKLLCYMEGMDPVKRQTGQHIEFEPEWEGAFNLQLKLEDNITMMVDWCGTNREVLLQACQATIKCLEAMYEGSAVKYIDHQVANHVVRCINYNVSAEKISIHLPVTRVLASLFPMASAFPQAMQDMEAQIRVSSLKPEQLIEPALRCLVMIAQTQANMWKRNGYSLLNQIYFYHNVRCRTQMYDTDILILQAGAAIMDPNHFLVHLINKFGLTNWVRADYDSTSQEELLRQIIVLAEEFLHVMINVMTERYVPGVGEVTKQDVLKHEIIHLLCLQPRPHSELAKCLPEDPYHDTGLENNVNEVADFKLPTSSQGKGMYELKPEFYSQYNPFFYHYSRADQSKAEEVQRKRKRLANEDEALPPPELPAFTAAYSSVVDVLTCDVMMHVLKLVLQRALAARSRSWSETQLEKIFHIIGIALHEEQRAHENGNQKYNFLSRATQGETSLLSLLESLASHSNLQHAAQKDLLSWVINKFQELRRLEDSSLPALPVGGQCPTSALDERQARQRKKKADKAARSRQKIMARMSAMQKVFISENEELFEETSTESEVPVGVMEAGESATGVALGPGRAGRGGRALVTQTCILCQEEQQITCANKAMVQAAFVQRSTVLSRHRGRRTLTEPDRYDPLFPPADLFTGTHSSTCSHVMHADCWQRFYDNVISKERRRSLRFRHHLSYDIDRFEYLCPYCKTLSNTVIPIIPYLSTLVRNGEINVELSFDDWLDGIQKTVHNSIQEARDRESSEDSYLFVPCPLSTITKMMAESVAKNFHQLFEYVYDDSSAPFHESINEMLKKFSSDVYKIGLGVNPDDDNARVPIMTWNTCAYTITTVEQTLRYDGRGVLESLSTRHEDCLSSVVRFAAVSCNVIQRDVVQKHCVTLLSALLCDGATKHLQETPSLLEIDTFSYLVSLVMSLPSLYASTGDPDSAMTSDPPGVRLPSCDLGDLHLLRLVFTAHIVQILTGDSLMQDGVEMEVEEETSSGEEEARVLLQVYRELRGSGAVGEMSAENLLRKVKQATLPFLRCCALLFHYLSDVRSPDPLLTPLSPQAEYDALCNYLALSPNMGHYFKPYFEEQLLKQLIAGWCAAGPLLERAGVSAGQAMDLTAGGGGQATGEGGAVKYPLTVNCLVPLPQDYSQLINKVSTFTCPNSAGDDSRAPTMCLVCGEMLCSQSYCCQTQLGASPVGAATAHAAHCGGGTGMFLRVRECQILLLNNRTKGCFYPPPYLDSYGETDQGLRRGNPLHLCPERYARLHKLWLSHSIPEEIAHHLESNTNLIAIEWNHL